MINYSKNIIQRVNFQPYNNLEEFNSIYNICECLATKFSV